MKPEKLTIEHLAPYLPNKLKWIFGGDDAIHEVVGLEMSWEGLHLISPDGSFGRCEIERGKPILRPLSDFSEEEWMNIFLSCCHEHVIELWEFIGVELKIHTTGRVVRLYDANKGMGIIIPKVTLISYAIGSKGIGNHGGHLFDCDKFFKEIYKLHGDIHGFIDENLAIDINTLEL